ncbi:M24 family metallopeptidase [Halomarina ordinaria]|uniref:M24 family metallopeptidase n=1 Tax=Halomarina ordinaria TaxID=3033939 RepID=A0ABD5U8A2_9EURY|nr:M24 family metallopeptidase [Halomarina sp. PSRA2]
MSDTTPDPTEFDWRTRRERLDAYLDANDLEAVWFARPNGFAWLTGGDNVVDRAGDAGVAAAGYDGEALTVVTDDIEAPRLRTEELPDCTVVTFDWYRADLPSVVSEVSPTPAAADVDVPGLATLDASALRQPLTDGDAARYRALCRAVAETVESVCRACERDDTERAVAARLRGDLAARGVDSPVALVGGGERARRYRHYTPTTAPLGDYALVSVTAERGGLFASCTRTVAFDPPTWLAERHRAAARVEATALAATRRVGREGGTAGEVFAAVQDAYDAAGFDGEWAYHHQGGAAGFAGREWIATPDHPAPVRLPMGYAWNPTVRGAKSEETVLVTEDGVETLTRTDADDWPTLEVTATDGSGVTVTRPALYEP